MDEQFTLNTVQIVMESTWSVAYKIAYDDGYKHGVFARSGEALVPDSRVLTQADLARIESEFVAACYQFPDKTVPILLATTTIFEFLRKELRRKLSKVADPAVPQER